MKWVLIILAGIGICALLSRSSSSTSEPTAATRLTTEGKEPPIVDHLAELKKKRDGVALLAGLTIEKYKSILKEKGDSGLSDVMENEIKKLMAQKNALDAEIEKEEHKGPETKPQPRVLTDKERMEREHWVRIANSGDALLKADSYAARARIVCRSIQPVFPMRTDLGTFDELESDYSALRRNEPPTQPEESERQMQLQAMSQYMSAGYTAVQQCVNGYTNGWLALPTEDQERDIPEQARQRIAEIDAGISIQDSRIPTDSHPISPPSKESRDVPDSDPVLLRQVQAQYSDEARRAKYNGDVRVAVTIDASGNIGDIKIIDPTGPNMTEQIEVALRQWKFKPAIRNGVPVSFNGTITMNFHYQ